MAVGNGLGRVFNVVAVDADSVYVSLKDAEAVTFVCYKSGGDTYTISEASAAANGNSDAQTLAKITKVSTSDGVGGVWTDHVQAASEAYVSAADCAVFTIRADQLSDGFKYLKCVSTSSGTVVAITHDLKVQRTPANLPSLIA
jgi:hypothetical protein